MNSQNFVTELRRSLIQLADAVDAVEEKIDQFVDGGATNCFDPYFNNTTPDPKDPTTKDDLIAAGGVVQELSTWLGTGSASRRAKLNKIR